MEMKKQKKIIGGMILVLAVTACASFFKSAACLLYTSDAADE